MKISCIYVIENIINKKRYVGSTNNYYPRMSKHRSLLNSNKHSNYYLQKSWNKYGSKFFTFFILEKVEEKDLIAKEQWWIDNTKCEYNLCRTAGRVSGIKRRKESIEKTARKNIGKKRTEDQRNTMRNSQLNLYHNGYSSPACKLIMQFTLDGEFIKEHLSVAEATRYLNLTERSSAIEASARGLSTASLGFIWIYSKDFTDDLLTSKVNKVSFRWKHKKSIKLA